MSNLDKLAPLVSPAKVAEGIASREKERRRRLGITQEQLASRSGVSLGSLRRFEQTGQISLESLVRLSRVLDCESELSGLFSKPAYRSIDEVIADKQASMKQAKSRSSSSARVHSPTRGSSSARGSSTANG